MTILLGSFLRKSKRNLLVAIVFNFWPVSWADVVNHALKMPKAKVSGL